MTPEDRVRAAVEELADALLAVARESAPPARDAAPVELISVAEFARRAGIGRSSAYLGVADGSLRSLRVRGRRLVPASELVRLAESATPARPTEKGTRTTYKPDASGEMSGPARPDVSAASPAGVRPVPPSEAA